MYELFIGLFLTILLYMLYELYLSVEYIGDSLEKTLEELKQTQKDLERGRLYEHKTPVPDPMPSLWSLDRPVKNDRL